MHHNYKQNDTYVILKHFKICFPCYTTAHTYSHLQRYTHLYWADCFESDLYKEEALSPHLDWNSEDVNVTVYATVSLLFLRYLTKRYIERLSPTVNAFNEFRHGRPEFYFFVSSCTMANISEGYVSNNYYTSTTDGVCYSTCTF